MQFQRKIQLISADSQLLNQLEIELIDNGYFPVVAKNWKDAEENYGAESPLIALIDLRLPSGVQIVQNSKEASPTTECIVLAEDVRHPSVTEAINIGASNFLMLPPDTNQLLAILRRTLENYQIQQLYRESESRFRSIVETIDDAIILLGVDGNIFYWNDAAAATFGYSKGDLINKSIENILKEEEREIFQRDFQKFVDKGGQPIDQFPFRYMGIRKNGTTFPVELVLLFFEADGKKYFTATVHDLTSQVEIRDELEKKEQIFKNMVDGSPMGVHIYRLDADGQLIFAAANSSAGEILGMDNSQYIGKTIAEVFPSLVQTEIPERYRRAASLGESWHSEQISYKDENIDGVFEVHVFQTSPGNAAVLFSDVTERIQTVEQLRIQSAALNAAATGIIITGFEGKTIWANPAMETLTGYSIDEIVGRSPEIFSSGYHDETFYQKMGQVVHTNKIWRGEIINRRKDGSVYPEYQIIAPVQNEDGDFTHYIAIKQDISERKQAEAAIKASEERFITIFQSSPNPVSITSFPNSAFIDVNESFLQASGYNREEIIGKPVAEIGFWTSIEDRNFVFNTLQKEKRITNYEMNYRRKNGEISTALISADFINLDGENFLLTSYYDIFDRKQAETEIQRRIRQLASINEMGQLVASSLELSQVFEKVVRAIPSLVDAEWVTVLLLEYQGELVVKAVGGEGGEKLLDKRIPSTEGLAGEVVRSE